MYSYPTGLSVLQIRPGMLGFQNSGQEQRAVTPKIVTAAIRPKLSANQQFSVPSVKWPVSGLNAEIGTPLQIILR